eukprot:TRINITY_DN34812_c0_g1_i1.p1 TRINITY_DN34812_c0_g1~~TRINITY_DN34812_c0_g1_i1.p1  ORF type:complete len:417 (-),score=71.95 TRINITY_DN34812_c0_g1_i1:79-1269(-)
MLSFGSRHGPVRSSVICQRSLRNSVRRRGASWSGVTRQGTMIVEKKNKEDPATYCWKIGEYRDGHVHWQASPLEEEVRSLFAESRGASKVLFSNDGVPVEFSLVHGVDAAVILQAYKTGATPAWEAAAESVSRGDEPYVPPHRSPVVQRLLQGAMQAAFNRKTVTFFSAQPLRNTSLCYFDIARHRSVRNYVALTFDDAPCRLGQANSRVPEVLAMLRAYDAHATFMMIGKYAAQHEEDLVDLLRSGHELGNHGMLDRSYHKDSLEEFAGAVDECNACIYDLQLKAGVTPAVRWFRAPHGKYNRTMESVLRTRGLTNVMCDTYASCPIVQDGEFIGSFLARRARHGSILLLHMPERGFRDWCLDGLRHLLEGLRARGLQAVTVSELERLALTPEVA